jgi:hypothetical protein
MGNKMTDHLATGSLSELIGAMPPRLRRQLKDDITRLDLERRGARRPGDPKVITMENHLKWITKHKPELGLMKLRLFGVLVNYLPLKLEHMLNNQLPSLSDCSYFWGLKIKQAERESTKQTVHA